MDRQRDQFLAGAGFTSHQHRRHAARHLGDAGLDALHHGRLPDQSRQCISARGRSCRQGRCGASARTGASPGARACGLERRSLLMQCRGDCSAELLQVDRLGQVVECTRLEGFDRVLGRTVGRHDKAALAALGLLQAMQQFHAQPIGQPHVGDHGIELRGLQVLPGFGDASCRFDAVAFAQQGQFVQRAQVRLVIDDQDVRGAPGCTGRMKGTHVAIVSNGRRGK